MRLRSDMELWLEWSGHLDRFLEVFLDVHGCSHTHSCPIHHSVWCGVSFVALQPDPDTYVYDPNLDEFGLPTGMEGP